MDSDDLDVKEEDYDIDNEMDDAGGDDDRQNKISYEIDDAGGDDDRQNKISYEILSLAEIQQLQREDINQISTILCIFPSSSAILLRHYNWDVEKVHKEWFADEPRVREAVGLPEHPAVTPGTTTNPFGKPTCGICFIETLHLVPAMACGHGYCRSCWMDYISSSIKDGPGCLILRCPDPSCGAAIGKEMVDLLACDGDREKYLQYLTRSYIDDTKKRFKWCPSPGCEFAVKLSAGCSKDAVDVCCRCSYRFCWNCTEESHRPLNCDLVADWIAKNSSDSEAETSRWLLANTKPCPKCKRPIEKNKGCMHMTCSAPCEFEFCWLCLGSWEEHADWTGGCYASSPYGEANKREKAEKARKESAEAYAYYYQRWVSNHRSSEEAMKHLQDLENWKLDYVGNILVEFLSFVIDAWLQIVECRRLLKWIGAYWYYLTEQDRSKKHFFKHLLGEAEAVLEQLYHHAEELEVCFQKYVGQSDHEEFSESRKKLSRMTSTTRAYFENLVRDLEEKELKGAVMDECTEEEDMDDIHWYCNRCTFANPLSTGRCQMCEED